MKKLSCFLLSVACSIFVLQARLAFAQSADGPPALPPTSPAVDQAEAGPDVVGTYDTGSSVTAHTVDSVAELVGLHSNEIVNVTIRYGEASAASIIDVVPLDGGRIIGNDPRLSVGADGNFSFKFQAGTAPGLYRLQLTGGGQSLALQFWVFDGEHPEKNPPVLTPAQ